MTGHPGGLHSVYLNRGTLERDKQLTGFVNSVTQEEGVTPFRTLYPCLISHSTCKPVETTTPKILPIARSYYNNTNSNTLSCSTSCVSLPYSSLLESRLGAPLQPLHTRRLDDVKKDLITPSRPLPLDGSVESSHITETPRNARKAFGRISCAIQEHRNPQNRVLGSLEKVTFSKPGGGKDSIGQLPHHLNVLPIPHESMTNTNIGSIKESNKQPRPLGQPTTMFQKPRELSAIRDLYTEEDVIAFFDLTHSTAANALMTPNDNSFKSLENSTTGKLFNENSLSVIDTALAVSFSRDGAKRRSINSRSILGPAQKKVSRRRD